MAFTYNAAANKPEVKRELSGGLGMPHDDDSAQSYRSQVPGVLLTPEPIIKAPAARNSDADAVTTSYMVVEPKARDNAPSRKVSLSGGPTYTAPTV